MLFENSISAPQVLSCEYSIKNLLRCRNTAGDKIRRNRSTVAVRSLKSLKSLTTLKTLL